MVLPPRPVDPKKDLFKEFARYAIEHHRYQKAMRDGLNEHGPWQQTISLLKKEIKNPPPRGRSIEIAARIGDIEESYLREGYY